MDQSTASTPPSRAIRPFGVVQTADSTPTHCWAHRRNESNSEDQYPRAREHQELNIFSTVYLVNRNTPRCLEMTMRIVLVVICALTLAACGGGSSSGGGSAATSSLTGSWVGSWEADPGFSGSGLARLNINQSGGEVSGTGSLTGSVCFVNVSFDGIVSGNSVSVNMVGELGAVTVNLRRIGENRMEGTATVVASNVCAGTSSVVLNRE